LLPQIRKQGEAHVVIGDNLSSTMSRAVVEICQKHNIRFVALPPNPTHLTQSLDIAYFRPLKVEWRKILQDHKTLTGDGVLQKTIFPRLLKRLVDNVVRKKRHPSLQDSGIVEFIPLRGEGPQKMTIFDEIIEIEIFADLTILECALFRGEVGFAEK